MASFETTGTNLGSHRFRMRLLAVLVSAPSSAMQVSWEDVSLTLIAEATVRPPDSRNLPEVQTVKQQ